MHAYSKEVYLAKGHFLRSHRILMCILPARKVMYSSKFLQSDYYTKNMAAQRMVMHSFGMPDPCETMFERPVYNKGLFGLHNYIYSEESRHDCPLVVNQPYRCHHIFLHVQLTARGLQCNICHTSLAPVFLYLLHYTYYVVKGLFQLGSNSGHYIE